MPKGAIKEGLWKDHLKEKREGGKIRVHRGNGPPALTNVSIERKKSGLYGLCDAPFGTINRENSSTTSTMCITGTLDRRR